MVEERPGEIFPMFLDLRLLDVPSADALVGCEFLSFVACTLLKYELTILWLVSRS